MTQPASAPEHLRSLQSNRVSPKYIDENEHD
jgi:hypothetical protein